MAIFERPFGYNHKLDDTQAIICVIETAQEVNGHTEYLLRLQRGTNKENSWKILRRYNDFAELHKCLCISGIDLPMPGKRLFGNMRPDFIAERRQALQIYINAVLMNPILASSLPAKRFVDPDSYSQSFHDQAVQNAMLCLRSEGIWTLGSTLGPIGWRLRKHYFKVSPKPPEKTGNKLLVKSGSQSHQGKHFATSSSNGGGGGSSSGSIDGGNVDPSELVLEWIEYGPDKYVDDKELGSILKSLMGLQHPHIETIVYAAHNENGSIVVRRFYKQGTLKDILCMATPKNPFLSKYGNPKGRTALTMKQVAIYGRQILEALIFIHSKGYPYGHLHAGNIVIVDDCVKLLDIENYLLGVPAFYRPFFVQHSKIHSVENIDVYSFGHVLFEMAMGYPLQESVARQITECPETLKNLLESILSKEAVRAGLPSLQQLIGHQFFAQHASSAAGGFSCCNEDSRRTHFKLSLNAKEILKQAAQKSDLRLRDEQKSVKNQKRIVRVQEMMSSEEEKRKSKQKAKLEHKQSKLKQQGSLQAGNGRLSLSAASGSAALTAFASSTSGDTAPFERADSVLSMHMPRELSTAATSQFVDIKSPPFEQQQSTAHEKQQQQQHSSSKQPTLLANVERQASSPNISIDTEQGSEPTRSALLESICKFNRGSLRKVRSND
ncbi:PREDICTED: PX domain-containing protein kinase-like protein [Rhagoletis zephyria]|uniref:PX domain-containing protein kinase-like protein n=1 Tax=Rhagoletis zephyria TaxID=28612 RepID=UPI0008119D97|nr:PREDICTED: PX domain-containing protein kinase-like protein [Rhagoletis zephyria]XP_036330967.1 PX domain-containing protein kinase-like protein [Rhagoletis pomonella]